MHNLRQLFLSKRFYTLISSIVILAIFGNFTVIFYVIAKILLGLLAILLILDGLLLFQGHTSCTRGMADRFSNGDDNKITYDIKNSFKFPITIKLIDEFPSQFQIREPVEVFTMHKGDQAKRLAVHLRPVTRGVYHFGNIRLLCSTPIGLVSRRITDAEETDVAVYPSFAQLRKTELLAFSKNKFQQNTIQRQRPGNSKEFDQIKEYVTGDDYRKLNWKASARFDKLMVNEYQEECSRHVYQFIDMGRTMKMPFEGMTLLDYAINASLSVANIILKKRDNTGLITYSSKVHSIIKSDNRKLQMSTILETLYNQKTQFNESNLEQPYALLNKNSQGRSLLIFYTNFESTVGLQRQLPILKKLAQRHLVILVSFVNTKLVELTENKAHTLEDIYTKALAENHQTNHDTIMDSLHQHGITSMKVRPNELTMSVINKYLEIKSRGVL